MIKHVVMWNIQNDLDKDEVMKTLKEKLEALNGKIPFIQKLEIGFNYNTSDAAHDIILYSEFNSKEDLEQYVVHPDHVEVGKYVRSVTTDRVVVDYEI